MAALSHVHSVSVDLRTRRLFAAIATVLALVTAWGMFVLRPGGNDRPDLSRFGTTSSFYDGRVVGAEQAPCAGTEKSENIECEWLRIELLAGPDSGEKIRLEFVDSPSTPKLVEGDKIVLSYSPEAGKGSEYQFADRQRKPVLLWLALLFAIAVIVLGRARGAAALIGLAASLVILLAFALPAIIDGQSPIWVALVASAAISFFALYLAHGFGVMTTIALLGTLASLALTGVLAVIFVQLAEFSGFSNEEAVFLQAAGGAIDIRGLMLAGMVIGALGALDDMTVTQSSAILELRAANPDMPFAQLLSAGMRIGRDHVASTVNTLFLAYTGASMPLLVLFVLSEQSLGSVANSEIVSTEIVRTLVGSIGLVASVPLTTWLAARTVSGGRIRPGRSPQ